MNILIIASDIGKTAPGIVYETLLSALAEENNISLICPSVSSDFNISKLDNVFEIEEPFHHIGWEKLLIKLLGRNIIDDLYVTSNIARFDFNFVKEIDFIISFASFHHYVSTLLGYKLSRKFQKKWIIYSVDAIPAPIGWLNDSAYYLNCKRFFEKYISRSDAFMSSNPEMLKYQLSGITHESIVTGVLYTPIRENVQVEHGSVKSINFLYTGGIYGPRKKESVLDGFRLFLQDHPDATFTFVGNHTPINFKGYEDLIEDKKIILAEFTNNLHPYYENATVLIDINAYFENDVFLSSKIINYLPVNRPIVTVTGSNSPTRNLFTKDPSIIHAFHNAKDVYRAMIEACHGKFDMKERGYYVELLSLKNQINNINKVLDQLQ